MSAGQLCRRAQEVAEVVDLTRYRSKGLLTMAREFFVLVSRGHVAGFKYQAVLKDGRRKCGTAGAPVEGGSEEDCSCLAALSCARRIRK